MEYSHNIILLLKKQNEKGLKKYGVSLEENKTLSTAQRIEHLQEELIDALNYCEHLKKCCNDFMTVNDYQRQAMRTKNQNNSKYEMLKEAIYGLNGEAGEIIDLIKKHEFQGHNLDIEKLIEEAGDVCWYLALLAESLSFPLEKIMKKNIQKIKERYPNGFDKNNSIFRDKKVSENGN